MSKLHLELQKNSNLFNDFLKVKKSATTILSKNSNYGITDHGLPHSERILEYLNKLYDHYFITFSRLNECEVFILFTAVYLHDIGYYLEDEEILKDFCLREGVVFPHKDREKFYRKLHPQISAYWIMENLISSERLPGIYFGETDFGYIIMKIISSHGLNFWEHPAYSQEIEVKGYKVRELYLSYLLCMADTMDCDKRRLHSIGQLNQYKVQDRIFLRRHVYIDCILISKNKIRVSFCIPFVAPENYDTFQKFYIEKPLEWLYLLLKKGPLIFGDTKFNLELCIDLKKSSNLEEPTEEEYSFIRNNGI